MTLGKYKETTRLYYEKLKRDPSRYRLYLIRKNANTKRWYLKVKHNFPKYEALLKKHNDRLRLYRAEKSEKYLQFLRRRRVRRAADPFKYRQDKKKSFEKMKRDPVRYQRYLDRCITWYYEMKKDPAKYRVFLEERKVYQRYRKIVKQAAALGDSCA